MKKKYILLTSLAMIMMITSCGETPVSSSNSTNVEQSSSSNNGDSSSIYIPTEEEYVIVARTYVGITITPNKTKAKKGEVITLNVTLDSGYTLKKLYLNGSENGLTKVNDTTYTFTMPNQSAIITADLSVSGDVTLQGSIAVPLTKDETTGIYSVKGIEVQDKAYLSYVVNGTALSVIAIDTTKCFADLDLNYGTGKEGSFVVAGNAVYDFFYDPNNGDTPCYVVRTDVLKAPTTAEAFESLFSGSIKSEPTTWPQNVAKVEYTNSKTGDEYKWTNYENGSLGVSKITDSTKNVKTSYVYKSIDETSNMYTIVDNYIEGSKGTADPTRNDDSIAYSGKYKMVDAFDEFVDSQYLTNEAYFDSHHYSHDVESLDFDIHYGYRTGFDQTWDETLVDFNIVVSSVDNIDGGFTTTVESFKDYDLSKDASEASNIKYHLDYKIEFTFNKAGAPVSGSYIETYYSSDAYNIDTDSFLPNGENMGVINKQMSFTYTYGTPKTGDINFDPTPYFASDLNNLTINNPTTERTGNYVQQNDLVNEYVSFDVYPETALDGWQYKIIGSSDYSIIGPRASNELLKFQAHKVGASTLTIGNGSSNHLTKTLDVEVINSYLVDGFYLQAYNAYYDEEIYADYAYVKAGFTKKAVLNATSRNTGKYVTGFYCGDLTITSSNPSLLTASAEFVNDQYVISFDASGANGITTATSVTLTVTCDNLEPGYLGKTLTVNIMPYTKPSQSIFGTWNDASDNPTQPVEIQLNNYVDGDNSTYSVLSVDGNTYNIKFNYDESSGKMSASCSQLDYIDIVYDGEADQIGICAVSLGQWSGLDEVTEGEVILGSITYDEEGSYVAYTYYFLDRVN